MMLSMWVPSQLDHRVVDELGGYEIMIYTFPRSWKDKDLRNCSVAVVFEDKILQDWSADLKSLAEKIDKARRFVEERMSISADYEEKIQLVMEELRLRTRAMEEISLLTS